jgi:hypothetical protein
MDPNKAPGPDGFPILFYQKIWDLIKTDIVQLFSAFYHHQLDISKFNRVFIWLIPKVYDISTVKDVRPISLLNCSFKIFTKKVLTSHLHPVLDRLIGVNQHAFLKGCNIMNNVIAAHEYYILYDSLKNQVFYLSYILRRRSIILIELIFLILFDNGVSGSNG